MDPTFFTSMQSLDLGSVYTPDGREHPITALTPMYSISSPSDVAGVSLPADPGNGTSSQSGTPGLPGSSTVDGWLNKIFGTTPQDPMGIGNGAVAAVASGHYGARFAVGILAIGILLIVVARLTLTE